MNPSVVTTRAAVPWNKGQLIGQKLPLKLREILAIRIRFQLAQHIRDLCSVRKRDAGTVVDFADDTYLLQR